MLFLTFVSLDLVRNLYDFRGDSPASGLVKSLAGPDRGLSRARARGPIGRTGTGDPDRGRLAGADLLGRGRAAVDRSSRKESERMVEPSWWARAMRPWVVVAGRALRPGPGRLQLVPKSRLDDCHRLSQTLQAENARLKDTTVSLRSQNQDLNQRAVDDARRLRLQEEEIQRLVQSVSAYQDERDQLAAAFERLKGQIRTSAGRPGRPRARPIGRDP